MATEKPEPDGFLTLLERKILDVIAHVRVRRAARVPEVECADAVAVYFDPMAAAASVATIAAV